MSISARKNKNPKIPSELMEGLSAIPDKRIGGNKRHLLKNIIFIAICAVLCGADSWLVIEKTGKCKLKWFRKFLWLPYGIPSHDTFARVFATLEPSFLKDFLAKWTNGFHDLIDKEVVALDGKTQRRSFDKASKKSAIHIVTAFACEAGFALGLTKVDSKANEITAIPEVLDMIDVNGAIVTIDAIGCQKKIAEKIREKGADYVLALKKNQPALYVQAKAILNYAMAADQQPDYIKFYETKDHGHGRDEMRRYWITNKIGIINRKNDWKDLKSIGCVESTRIIDGKETVEVRYFIASIDPIAQLFAKSVRSHWKIENSYHWRLDVIFQADHNRMRLGHSAENFSILQAITLNMLKREDSSKDSIRIKRHMCALDEKYLQQILSINRKKSNA